MKKSDVDYLYYWASRTEFPLRKAPTSVGYAKDSNTGDDKDIYFCWLKARRDTHGGVRESVVDDPRALEILQQEEILLATVAVFTPDTDLPKHKDPDVYDKPYRRIQIPLSVCPEQYMIWEETGETIHWQDGEPQVWDVMDHPHSGYNHSEEDMVFLFLDIQKTDDNSTLQEV